MYSQVFKIFILVSTFQAIHKTPSSKLFLFSFSFLLTFQTNSFLLQRKDPLVPKILPFYFSHFMFFFSLQLLIDNFPKTFWNGVLPFRFLVWPIGQLRYFPIYISMFFIVRFCLKILSFSLEKIFIRFSLHIFVFFPVKWRK